MIGSPNHMHLDHIRIGLEAGIKVFCEKPIVSTIEQSLELAALLSKHGPDRLMVGLVLRYAPLYRDLRAAQAAGTLGHVVSIEAAEHIEPYHGAFFMRDWRRYGRYAGSFMLEKCCHDLDLYNGVVGARPERVASFGGRKSFIPANDPSRDGVNDLQLFHRKPSGLARNPTRSSTVTAISSTIRSPSSKYANGVAMNFHTNLTCRISSPLFAVVVRAAWRKATSFAAIWTCTRCCRAGGRREALRQRDGASQHYAPTEQMAAEDHRDVRDGGPLPVSPLERSWKRAYWRCPWTRRDETERSSIFGPSGPASTSPACPCG